MSFGDHPSNNFPAFPFIASQVMFIALKVTNRWLGCAQMQLKEYSNPPPPLLKCRASLRSLII